MRALWWLAPSCNPRSSVAIHASAGDGKLVDYLLGMGADPDISSAGDPSQGVPKGTTPLMQSAKRGKLEVVKRLLRAGADANTVDSNRHNALFYALYFDKPDVAKELIQRGGKLTGDAIGGPVYHGNLELVKLLIKKKASVDCVFRSFEPKGLFIDGERHHECDPILAAFLRGHRPGVRWPDERGVALPVLEMPERH